jgi:hypothetical protein
MGLDQNIFRKDPGAEDEVEVAYFRKVNFLHGWVQDHLNNGEEHNCVKIPMHLEAIAGLAQSCKQVLADPSLADKLLPPRSGFFFGSTEVDEDYLSDVQEVSDVLDVILMDEASQERPGQRSYFYWSWW